MHKSYLILCLLYLVFFNQTSRKTAQINCQLHKKIITMFRCKLNSGLCFSSEVLLAGAGEGGTYVRKSEFQTLPFHVLNNRPCPCWCSAHLDAVCRHFI